MAETQSPTQKKATKRVRTPVPARPGSGWLVAGGSVQRVQVARRRSVEAGDAAN